MKRFILTIFFSLWVISFVEAQTPEVVSELSPLVNGVGKFSNKLPKSKIKFDAKIQPLNLSDGKTGVAVTIQTTYDELVFATIDEKPQARVRFYGRIFSDDKKIDGEFEEVKTVSFNLADAQGERKSIVSLQKIFELPKGNYKIHIIFNDIEAGDVGTKIIKFQIPYLR